MNDRMERIIKLLGLPVVILIIVIAGRYLGIFKTPYAWAYIGLQVVLFIIYTYILFKDRQKYVPADKKLKGKRDSRKKIGSCAFLG